ncbi:MAG: hypothetical protein HZY76_00355 [Anaerolineae bacterium]|nr:MAG: hypothetical protein HZY76_00355 [Anaerolineae bacterium]
MFDVTYPVSTTDTDAPSVRSSPVMFIENAGQWDDGAFPGLGRAGRNRLAGGGRHLDYGVGGKGNKQASR